MATSRLLQDTVAAGAQQAGSGMNTVNATWLGKDVCRWTALLACCSLHTSYSCWSGLQEPAATHALHATQAAGNLPVTDLSWLLDVPV